MLTNLENAISTWKRAWKIHKKPVDGIAYAVPLACKTVISTQKSKFRMTPEDYYVLPSHARRLALVWIAIQEGDDCVPLFAQEYWDPSMGAPNPPIVWSSLSSMSDAFLNDLDTSDLTGESLELTYEYDDETFDYQGHPQKARSYIGHFANQKTWDFVLPFPRSVVLSGELCNEVLELTQNLQDEFLALAPPTLRDSAYAFSLSLSCRSPLSPPFLGAIFVDKIQDDYAGTNYAEVSDARLRLQFCASMPVMASMLADNDKFLDYVDSQRPIDRLAKKSALHSLGKIPVLTVMQACKLTHERGEERRCIGASTLLDYVSNMEPSFASRLPEASPEDLMHLMSLAIHAPWTAERLKPVHHQTGIGVPPISEGRVWVHLYDMALDMWECILYPDIGAPTASLAEKLLKTVNLVDLYSALERHADGGVTGMYLNDSKREICWPIPSQEQNHDGLTLRFLSSANELTHESRMMQHCVESYADYCKANRCHIGSIGIWDTTGNEASWVPNSTFELKAPKITNDKKTSRPYVEQHMGYGNRRPDAICLKVFETFMKDIETGKVDYDFTILNSPKQIIKSDDVVNRLGFDWNTPEEHTRRWNLWRRFLNLKAKTVEAWVSKKS